MGIVELALVLALLGLLVLRRRGGVAGPPAGPDGRADCPAGIVRRWPRRSARHAGCPAHDEVDDVTRVLLRRTYTGLDGHPAVLEERVLETFPAHDAAWEGLFTEAMSRARFRCAYLNAEEFPG